MAKQTFTTGQVLTAAQMTDLQQTAMTGGAASTKTVSYVLVAADAGTRIAMNAAGATTITVNTSLFSAGDTVSIQNIGAGVCTITAGTATVNTSGSLALAQYQGGILYFTSASTAIFFQFAIPSAGSGGYTLLSTASPAAASSVTFSSISQSYKHLVMVWRNLYNDSNAAGQTWGLRMNNDSGTNYSFYSNGFSNANELTQSTTQIGSTNASAGFLSNMTASSTAVDSQGFGSATIWDYTATTNHQVEWKSFGTATGFQNSAANGVGSYKTSSAITRLDLIRLGGTQTLTGTILLYGVS